MTVDFEAVFAAFPAPVLVVTASDFTVASVNDFYLQTAGVSRADLIGKNFFDALAAEEKKGASGFRALRASWDSVVSLGQRNATQLQRFDVRGRGGKVTRHYWSTANAPLKDRDGNITHIIHEMTDSTERVNAIFFSGEPIDSADLRVVAMPERSSRNGSTASATRWRSSAPSPNVRLTTPKRFATINRTLTAAWAPMPAFSR